MTKGRMMGLDFGTKTIGVALSDPFGWTAQGLEVIRRKEEANLKASVTRLLEIIGHYGVTGIILGYPKNMNNTEGPKCQAVKSFQKRLERDMPGIPVTLWDERLSTVAAERSLLEADLSRQKRGQVIDKMAAVYILQGYLDATAKNNTEEL